jgi:FtsP/CotA-like multicopper oxidase with cupredoxin domain
MKRHKLYMSVRLILLATFALALGMNQGWAQSDKNNKDLKLRGGKVTTAEKKAAADRLKAQGQKPGVAGTLNVGIPAPTAPDGPGGTPHYFGPFGNWAYSPLPTGTIASITLDAGGTGYTAPVVTIEDVYGTGTGATAASASVDALTGAITAISGGLGGTGYTAPIVTITDPTGTGAAATPTLTALIGGIHKFMDRLPQLGPGGANNIIQSHGDGQYISVAISDTTAYPVVVGPPAKPASDYYEIALVEFSEKMHSELPATRLRGYVQLETPGTLAAMAALNPAIISKHVALPGGLFAIDYPHYLGPTIMALADRPVRIKFYNLLSTGAGGDLFLPVDKTVTGAGVGPDGVTDYTQNRAAVHLHGNNTVWISDGTPHQWITPASDTTPYPKGVSVKNVPDMGAACDTAHSGCETIYYTNAMSARLMFYHDHALAITRLNVYAGEAAGYVITDAVDQDMINGTNLSGVNNVTASVPLDLGQTNAKVLPGIGIPLVIQDRTFVDPTTIWAQDPTWNSGTGNRDAGTGNITEAILGDLWYPHVYMSAQNPWDLTGTNAYGRWHYGPWFVNPTATCADVANAPGCIDVGPVPNIYYQPVCDGLPDPINTVCTAPWEPPMRPGVPNPSIPGEAFMDTPIVNGTAYPYLEVEPKAYRFRILNASNDRFVNLQLYVAADKRTPTTAPLSNPLTTKLCDGVAVISTDAPANCTEVKMVPVSANVPNQYADWPSGVPDPTTAGPNWIQIGTEGGFLPAPVVVPQQPIGWNTNATAFNYGNVNQHSLLLGSAERADVVVDFTGLGGKTLILYNDAPAAFPAGVAVYDYFTGVADQTANGGAPTTQPGYGPNTRTIMQIRVAASAAAPLTPDVTLANLQTVFKKTASKSGVFEKSQDPIILPQAAYNSAYNNTFTSTASGQYFQIADTQKTFKPINADGSLQATAISFPLEMKAMHDEMGGVYDTQFGRMSGMLGLSNPKPGAGFLLPYGYASPPTDIVGGTVALNPIGSPAVGVFPDGTQIWRIFHNGVDTHTIHVHLFNAQLINRVGQDGIMLPPDANELGWKDTFRINPLEITYLAMRPIIPTPAQLPFQVPNSVRLIDPTLPPGVPLPVPSPAGWFDPAGEAITTILNHEVNFGWEYVWHCHILAHEEMDMMHSLDFVVPPNQPTLTSANLTGGSNNKKVDLTWTDPSLNETSYTVQVAENLGFSPLLRSFSLAANTTKFTDLLGSSNKATYYRVQASNTVGDIDVYPAPSIGFPTKTLSSSFSNTMGVNLPPPPPPVPAVPSNVHVTCARNTTGNAANRALDSCTVTWTDASNNETGFRIQSATNSGFSPALTTNTVNAGVQKFTVGSLQRNTPHWFRVQSFNVAGPSAYVTAAENPITTP